MYAQHISRDGCSLLEKNIQLYRRIYFQSYEKLQELLKNLPKVYAQLQELIQLCRNLPGAPQLDPLPPLEFPILGVPNLGVVKSNDSVQPPTSLSQVHRHFAKNVAQATLKQIYNTLKQSIDTPPPCTVPLLSQALQRLHCPQPEPSEADLVAELKTKALNAYYLLEGWQAEYDRLAAALTALAVWRVAQPPVVPPLEQDRPNVHWTADDWACLAFYYTPAVVQDILTTTAPARTFDFFFGQEDWKNLGSDTFNTLLTKFLDGHTVDFKKMLLHKDYDKHRATLLQQMNAKSRFALLKTILQQCGWTEADAEATRGKTDSLDPKFKKTKDLPLLTMLAEALRLGITNPASHLTAAEYQRLAKALDFGKTTDVRVFPLPQDTIRALPKTKQEEDAAQQIALAEILAPDFQMEKLASAIVLASQMENINQVHLFMTWFPPRLIFRWFLHRQRERVS